MLAHEVCHYIALRDIDRLDADFSESGAEKPWWIDELKKLRAEKGLDGYYDRLLGASRRYQYIWWKQCLESVRRSPILHGFHMLQLSDTERYENSNGLLDPFDEPQWLNPRDFLRFNADAVLAADLPRRCFSSGEAVDIPVWLSHTTACSKENPPSSGFCSGATQAKKYWAERWAGSLWMNRGCVNCAP